MNISITRKRYHFWREWYESLNVQELHSWLGKWIRERVNIFHALLREEEMQANDWCQQMMDNNMVYISTSDNNN